MLASVLNSRVAVQASVYVVRAFVRMRTALMEYADLSRRIDTLEATYDHRFKKVFDAIRDLMMPAIQPQRDPDPATTYFLFTGKKGEELPGIENHFSFDADGQVRGLDITTQLKTLNFEFAVSDGFRGKNFTVGQNIAGQEIGFTLGASPRER